MATVERIDMGVVRVTGEFDTVMVLMTSPGEFQVVNTNDYVYGSHPSYGDALAMAEYYADNDVYIPDDAPDVDEAQEWADFDPDC